MLGFFDQLLDPGPGAVQKARWDLVEIGDDAGLEDGAPLSWCQTLELSGGPRLSGHGLTLVRNAGIANRDEQVVPAHRLATGASTRPTSTAEWEI